MLSALSELIGRHAREAGEEEEEEQGEISPSKTRRPPLPIITYYTMVKCDVRDDPDAQYYVALGPHDFYVVDKTGKGVVSLRYAWLDWITLDDFDVELFRLDFNRAVALSEDGKRRRTYVTMKAIDRRILLDEMTVRFKTDYIYRCWDICIDPLERVSKAEISWIESTGARHHSHRRGGSSGGSFGSGSLDVVKLKLGAISSEAGGDGTASINSREGNSRTEEVGATTTTPTMPGSTTKEGGQSNNNNVGNGGGGGASTGTVDVRHSYGAKYASTLFSSPPADQSRESIQGYFFFRPSDMMFLPKTASQAVSLGSTSWAFSSSSSSAGVGMSPSVGTSSSSTMDFVRRDSMRGTNSLTTSASNRQSFSWQDDAARLTVTVLDPPPATLGIVLEPRESNYFSPAVSAQFLAERFVREIAGRVQDYKILGHAGPYGKRQNLAGDPSSWTCWRIRLRTYRALPSSSPATREENRRFEYRDVCVIAARRGFIPPTLQGHRDFIVASFSARKDFSNANRVSNEAEMVADSLSPESVGFERDDLVCQAIADALLLSHAGYGWYETNARIYPACRPQAKAFCKAVIAFLVRSGGWEAELAAKVVREFEDVTVGSYASGAGTLTGSNSFSSSHARTLVHAPSSSSSTSSSFSTTVPLVSASGMTAVTGTTAPHGSPARNPAHGRNVKLHQAHEDYSSSSSTLHQADPFEIAQRIVDSGIKMAGPGASEAVMRAWRARVWDYLAYCVDGGSYPGLLTIPELVRQWNVAPDRRVKLKIAQLLDAMLGMRTRGGEYAGGAFAADALTLLDPSASNNNNNAKGGPKKEFNRYVMARLLESGYVKACLTAATGDLSAYPRFLVVLLREEEEEAGMPHSADGGSERLDGEGEGDATEMEVVWGGTAASAGSEASANELRYAVLKRIIEHASSSTISGAAATPIRSSPPGGAASPPPSNTLATGLDVSSSTNASTAAAAAITSDAALNLLVPTLVGLLNSPRAKSDDKLAVLCVAALVNLSRNNRAAKASILAGGTARVVVSLLRSSNDDLVRHTCSLLLNLTKTPEFRINVARGPAVLYLVDLVERKTYAPHYRPALVVAVACNVLANLAMDAPIRRAILAARPLESSHVDADGKYSIPGVVRLLADFLIFPPATLAKDLIVAGARDKEMVQIASTTALKNLAVSSSSSTGTNTLTENETTKTKSGGRKSVSIVEGGDAASQMVKRGLGRYAGRGLLMLLKDTRDEALGELLLKLLYVLCCDVKVAAKLKGDGILDALETKKVMLPEAVLQVKSKLASYNMVLSMEQ